MFSHAQAMDRIRVLPVLFLTGAARGQIAIIEDHAGLARFESGEPDDQPPDPDRAVSPGAQTGEVVQVVNRRIAAPPAGDPLVPVHLFFPRGP